MNHREAFTYLRDAMLRIHASGVPEDELELDWQRAFEALNVLEPEDGRRLRRLREAAEGSIAQLAEVKPEVCALGLTEEISPGLLAQAVRISGVLRRIDEDAAVLMDRHRDDLAARAEVLAFRYELRVAAGWLPLAGLPGLPGIQSQCPNCKGRGYIETDESGARCTACEGSGTVEP